MEYDWRDEGIAAPVRPSGTSPELVLSGSVLGEEVHLDDLAGPVTTSWKLP